jgi:hypothetical protein
MDLKECRLLVTPTSYGKNDPSLKTELEALLGEVITTERASLRSRLRSLGLQERGRLHCRVDSIGASPCSTLIAEGNLPLWGR